MYDKFEYGRLVDLDPFVFKSNRFEIWEDGKLIRSQNNIQDINIMTERNVLNDSSILKVDFGVSNPLSDHIASSLSFDSCYFGTDRIIGATVPKTSNIDSNSSYSIFKSISVKRGMLTRLNKQFEKNEPYACSLFLIDGTPSKITFSNAITDLLIEFYWD